MEQTNERKMLEGTIQTLREAADRLEAILGNRVIELDDLHRNVLVPIKVADNVISDATYGLKQREAMVARAVRS